MMIDNNDKETPVVKDIEDITSNFLDKLNNDCLYKYNQTANSNNNTSNNKKRVVNKDHGSIKEHDTIQSQIESRKQGTINISKETIYNNQEIAQRPKTQMYSHKEMPFTFNHPYKGGHIQSKPYCQTKKSNKFVLDKKSKAVYSMYKNDTSITQTEPNISKNYFFKTYYTSSNTNKQFSTPASTAFFKKGPTTRPNCFSSNLRSDPNLVSYYSRKRLSSKKHNTPPFYSKEPGFKYYSEINKEYYHTQNYFYKPHDSTTDFKHMRFNNQFLDINQRKYSSITTDTKKNIESSQSGNKTINNLNKKYSSALPDQMTQKNDSSYNKFVYLTTTNNNGSREKRSLIYKFIKQREKRMNKAISQT